MSSSKTFNLLVGLLFFVFLAEGCASLNYVRMYEGAPRKKCEIAILSAGCQGINYLSVDGEKIGDSGFGGFKVELLPGRHVIDIECWVGFGNQTAHFGTSDFDTKYTYPPRLIRGAGLIEFEAVAGCEYRIVPRLLNNKGLIEIIDNRGRVIASKICEDMDISLFVGYTMQ